MKKVASPAKPVAGSEKATPFVIDAGNLSSFVDHSDATLPSTHAAPKRTTEVKPAAAVSAPAAKPVQAKPAPPVESKPVAPPVAAEPVKTPEPVATAAPVEAPPVEEAPVAEIKASPPPQPAVAENNVAAVDKPAPWQAPNALEGHHIMNEAIETGKKFAEDAKARLQTIVTDFNEKAKVAAEKSSKTAEELSDIAKGNLEALVESSKIAAKGFETLGQSAAEYGRSSFEKTSATLKSFASVKSPAEFFQLQSTLLTSTFDTLASETAKTSEAVLKLAGEIAQPLSNRYSVVSDKLKSLAA
ncbi:MAG TPA: TIGR01841 family phasin [Sphingobium sp.]